MFSFRTPQAEARDPLWSLGMHHSCLHSVFLITGMCSPQAASSHPLHSSSRGCALISLSPTSLTSLYPDQTLSLSCLSCLGSELFFPLFCCLHCLLFKRKYSRSYSPHSLLSRKSRSSLSLSKKFFPSRCRKKTKRQFIMCRQCCFIVIKVMQDDFVPSSRDPMK